MDDSMIFYKSFSNAIRKLPVEMQVRVYNAIWDYQFDGVEPELDGIEAAMLDLITPQLDANKKRRADGQKGGRPKMQNSITSGFGDEKSVVIEDEKTLKPVVIGSTENEKPNVNVNVNVNDNDNDNDNDNVNVNHTKRGRFEPPTVDEVNEYCRQRNNGIDGEEFVAFYASKGWMVGKNKMTNWKQAVITWEKNRKERAAPKNHKDVDDYFMRMIGGLE